MSDENVPDHRQAMRDHRSELEKAKIAAQDRRADTALQLRNRQSALDAAAKVIGEKASAKQVIALAEELLTWLEKE